MYKNILPFTLLILISSYALAQDRLLPERVVGKKKTTSHYRKHDISNVNRGDTECTVGNIGTLTLPNPNEVAEGIDIHISSQGNLYIRANGRYKGEWMISDGNKSRNILQRVNYKYTYLCCKHFEEITHFHMHEIDLNGTQNKRHIGKSLQRYIPENCTNHLCDTSEDHIFSDTAHLNYTNFAAINTQAKHLFDVVTIIVTLTNGSKSRPFIKQAIRDALH